MWVTIPAHIMVGLMSMFLGVLCFAYFHGCDPLALGEARTPDQLTILLASRVLGKPKNFNSVNKLQDLSQDFLDCF